MGTPLLSLHMAAHLGAMGWSTAMLPLWQSGLPPSKPSLQPSEADLRSLLTTPDLAEQAGALGAEQGRRLRLLLDGAARLEVAPRPVRSAPPVLNAWGETKLLDLGAGVTGPMVLLVPPLINGPEILDLTPQDSFAARLRARGLRPLLLDWGAPKGESCGFDADAYVRRRLLPALDMAARDGPVLLLGYCMGGLLAMAASVLKSSQVKGLALLATPWDFGAMLPWSLASLGPWMSGLEALATEEAPLAPVVLQVLFHMLDPLAGGRRLQALAAAQAGGVLAARLVALERWLTEGPPLAPPLVRDAVTMWLRHNTTLAGTWTVAGEAITPQRVSVPALVVLPDRDRLVPLASAKPLADGLRDVRVRTLHTGHVGLVAGRVAPDRVADAVARLR